MVSKVNNGNESSFREEDTLGEKMVDTWKSRWRAQSTVCSVGALASGVIGGVSVGQKFSGFHHLLAGKVSHLANAGISKLSATNFFLGHSTLAKVAAFVPKFGLAVLKFFATLLLSHPIILGAIGTIFLLGLVFNHIKSNNKFYNFFANRFISLALATAYAFKVVGRVVLQSLLFPFRIVFGIFNMAYRFCFKREAKIVGDGWFSLRRFSWQVKGLVQDVLLTILFFRRAFINKWEHQDRKKLARVFSVIKPWKALEATECDLSNDDIERLWSQLPLMGLVRTIFGASSEDVKNYMLPENSMKLHFSSCLNSGFLA